MAITCPKIENWVNCLHISDQFLRTLCLAYIKHATLIPNRQTGVYVTNTDFN